MKYMMRIKVCGYLRMSTDRQDTSIEIQRKRLIELAEREMYEIIEWYIDEGCSGSKDTEKRVEWLRMLASAATAEWEIVLVYSRSRFSRLDCIEEGNYKQTLRDAGKKLHALQEGLVDWETSGGRLVDIIHSDQAHEFSVRLGYVTLDGRVIAFNKGTGHGQICSYGMARLLKDNQGQPHPVGRLVNLIKPKGWTQVFVPGDPEEIGIVRWIFTEFVEKDVSYGWMARELNSKEIPSPDGKKWRAARIRCILLNEVYVGDLRFGRRVSGKFARMDGSKVIKTPHGSRPERKEGLLKKNTHEGIISHELWDRAQEKLKRMAEQPRQLPRGDAGFALKGILVCGNCGVALQGSVNNGPKGSGLVNYICHNSDHLGPDCGCANWQIRERDILPFVIARLTEAVDIRVLKESSVQPPRTEEHDTKKTITALEGQIAGLNRKITNGVESLLDPTIRHRDKCQAMIDEWEEEKVRLEKRLEQVKRKRSNPASILQEWQAWLAAVGKELVHVQTTPRVGAKFEPGLKFTPATFRETLKRYGCRVIIWWKRRTAERWAVDRVRILFGLSEKAAELLAKESEMRVAGSVSNEPLTSVNGSFVTAEIDLVFAGNDLFPCSRYAALLPMMREMRAKGATYQEIADSLNNQGFRTQRDQLWKWMNVCKHLKRNR